MFNKQWKGRCSKVQPNWRLLHPSWVLFNRKVFNLAWWVANWIFCCWFGWLINCFPWNSLGLLTWLSYLVATVLDYGRRWHRLGNWRVVCDRNITLLELICVSTPNSVRLNFQFIWSFVLLLFGQWKNNWDGGSHVVECFYKPARPLAT